MFARRPPCKKPSTEAAAPTETGPEAAAPTETGPEAEAPTETGPEADSSADDTFAAGRTLDDGAWRDAGVRCDASGVNIMVDGAASGGATRIGAATACFGGPQADAQVIGEAMAIDEVDICSSHLSDAAWRAALFGFGRERRRRV